ncbi:LLM class flavin-dependent oxidoreductase, partial [Dehalococcoidia bacterium]|nr:LLM class flavin-dependent oxidoreductase [Dehalococcoidia bacterium]
SAFNILPMWHPIRLAEDFAMADILTNGRVIFGAGRGYHTREVETFGAPMQDPDANRELFEEQFEIFLKACNDESFSHQGKHYTLPPTVPYRGYELKDLTLVPRPANRPVQTWQPIVSGSVRGLDFMAKHGINGIIMGTASHHVEAMVNAYHQANVRQSRHLALGQNIALGWWWRLDDTYEQAKENLRGAFEEHVKFAAPLGMLRYNDQQMERLGPGGVASHIAAGVEFDKVLESGAWFCGTPEDMIAHLKHIEDKYPGIEQIVLPFPMSLPADEAIDQAARFAREVMPAFKEK